jgi:nicotinate-nucleotide adenylyltransferase
MRVGLMGGTFDPVHVGHLWIAEAARVEFSLDRVIWIPAGDPPHKDAAVAPQEHRYAMVVLATATNPQFEVSRLELERVGPSYSLYTIEHFREQFPGSEPYFIIGADAILELLTWHRHEDVVRACRFAAVTRPGYDLDRLRAALPLEYLDRIDFLTPPGIDLSSTEIRDRVRSGSAIRYLVPEPVESYLRKHGLYLDAP